MTTRPISTGKLRALQRASTSGDAFTILAIDHQDALRRALRPDDPMGLSADELTAFKLDVVRALRHDVSGVLLDPALSAPQAIAADLIRDAGLLVELENADYAMEPLPLDVEIDANWGVSKIKRMGGDGVKLFFYYNAQAGDHTARQEGVIIDVVGQCAAHDIPFYGEPILYDASGDAVEALVLAAGKRMVELGVDVLKMEFPIDIKAHPQPAEWQRACEAFSAAVDAPWVLLSAGVDYETFVQQVEIACRAGASGFIAGRAVWGDACDLPTSAQRQAWLASDGLERIRHLSEIAARYARPWSDFYTSEIITNNWFRQYGAHA